MLLAVEGIFFLSSSASGYSKGLSILLGYRKELKPMRVTPWNQYQLVDQVTDPNLQLASAKNWLVRRCASFMCFGRTTAGLENQSTLKVGPTQNQEALPEPIAYDESKNQAHLVNSIVVDDSNRKMISLKSSLKKSEENAPVNVMEGDNRNRSNQEAACEKEDHVPCQTDTRKVQWTDTTGGELYEIREFEMSEAGSDYDFNHENGKICSCRIM